MCRRLFQRVRLQGVHLSQVHQPSNVDIPLTTLVHLRQVHPLKFASVKSVGASSRAIGSVPIRGICGRQVPPLKVA